MLFFFAIYSRQKKETHRVELINSKEDHFRLYRCKGMPGTVALHIVKNVLEKIDQKASGGQIVKSQKINVL